MSSPDSSPTPLPTLTSKPAYLKAVTYTGVTVLEGTTPWCMQCKAIAPEVHKLAAEYPDVHFYTYDVEQTPDIAHELGVSHMPTFSVFKDGDYVDSVRGAKVKEIRRAVEEAR